MSPYSFGILFHHHFLVPGRVPGLVSLLFGILFHHHVLVRVGFQGLSLFWYSVPSSFPGSIWFRVGFRGLSSCGILFHHHFLLPSGSGLGSGVCLPSLLAFCSIIMSWFHLVLGRVPGLVSLVSWHSVPSSCLGSFWFRVGFRGLSPYSFGILFLIISVSFWFQLGFRSLFLTKGSLG